MEWNIITAIVSFYVCGRKIIDLGYLDQPRLTLLQNYKRRQRAKSWLITLFSSGLMVWYGILYEHPPRRLYLVDWLESETDQSRFLTKTFLISMGLDCGIGLLEYRSEIDILSGWVHHAVYSIILLTFLQNKWSHSFTSCLWCEIPTFLLAIGNVFPRCRLSNRWISLVFFPTRIIWAGLVGLNFLMGSGWIRQIFVMPVLSVHIFWYCQLRRKL